MISDLGKADLEQAKGERHFVLSYQSILKKEEVALPPCVWAFPPARRSPRRGRNPLCPRGLWRLGRLRVAEPHGRSGSAAPIRRDSDGLWYALFAMQARENARLVSEQSQNSIFNFFFRSK